MIDNDTLEGAGDPTRFVERGFTWLENKGRNVRLINRNDPKQSIRIAWDDLSSLHELTALALADEPKKGSGLAAPDAAQIEIAEAEESEKQFHFWLNNHWPNWNKAENQQNIVELMWDAWNAALRLVRFDTLAHKGALNYIVELGKSQALTYRMARHIRNTDEVPITRWGVDGMDLLAELRDLNPEQYDAEVKGPMPAIPTDAVRQARRETETLAKLAFDSVMQIEQSEFQYSALQKASMVAATIRNHGKEVVPNEPAQV